MRWLSALLLVFLVTMAIVWPCQSAPAEGALRNQSNAKSAFGQPFDEVVVESTLNVKKRTSNISRNKREHQQRMFPGFTDGSSAVATAQAQSHLANSPFGRFGASASGSQSQSLAFGPNGPLFTAGFAGTQQYKLPNGQIFNVSFGNSLGSSGPDRAGGATVAVSGPNV